VQSDSTERTETSQSPRLAQRIDGYLNEIASLAKGATRTPNPTVRRDSIRVLILQLERLQEILAET
jgi:hypothetical protein